MKLHKIGTFPGVGVIICTVFAMAGLRLANAAERTWLGAGDGVNFSDPKNWDGSISDGDSAPRRSALGYSVTVPVVNTPGLERFGGREKVLAELRKLGAERVNLCIDKYLFDETKRREAMRTLEENSDWFKGKGLKTCAWLWAQLAERDAAPGMARVTESRWLGGNEMICPLDAGFREFAAGYVRDIAATGVEMILYDDDFGFRNIFGTGKVSCLCERHMEAYRKELGEDVSPEEFNRRVLSGGRNRWRDVWMNVNGRALLDFAKEMRRAVDDVNPKVRIGLCSVISAWDNDGTDAIEVAKALAGPSTRPFIRLTGAPYWAVGHSYYDCRVQNVVELSRMQLGWTDGSGAEVVAEGDVYPRPRENCPSAYLELFDMAMRADGRLDGIMKYALDYNHPVDYETGYVLRHQRNAKTYEWIARNMSKRPAVGVRIYEALHKLRDADIPEVDEPTTAIFLQFGSPAGKLIADASIPTVYEGEGICGAAFGENVKYVQRDAFRRGLVIDRRAAEILEGAGVSVGLREQCGDAPETFFHENQDGGRFFVLNFDTKGPKGRGYGISRTLADAVRKLSGTPLPAYVNGNPDLYVMVKRDAEATVVGLWNIFADSVIDGVVELDSPSGEAEFFNCTGRKAGSRVVIDEIQPFSFAGIAIRSKAQCE